MAARAGSDDAEGARSGYPVAGVRGCAMHAAWAVLSAGGVPERPDGHDEGADTVHRRTARVGAGRALPREGIVIGYDRSALERSSPTLMRPGRLSGRQIRDFAVG